MKKTVLFLFLSLVMIGCKDEKNEKPSENSENMVQETSVPEKKDYECITLKMYNLLATTEEKADWLREYGKAVCDDILDEATRNTHTINTTEFTAKPKGSLKKDWNEIKSKTSHFAVYESYISFKIDPVSKDIIDLKIIPYFDKKTPSYSLALFRSIAKQNNDANITFEFMYASVEAGETIVIKVTDLNNQVSYFDYSDEPKKKEAGVITRRIKSPL